MVCGRPIRTGWFNEVIDFLMKRRETMKGYQARKHAVFMCAATMLLAMSFGIWFSPMVHAQDATEERVPLAWIKAFGFQDDSFPGQTLRAIGQTYDGGADIGEVLSTTSRIKDGDIVSWYNEWFRTAERIRDVAEKSEKGGHRISAGEAYLRASNYYRASEFYLHADPSDPRALGAAKKSVDCFVKAIELLSIPVEIVRIPYEGTTLPGYFYTSPVATEKAPMVIVQTGFDGTAEELYGDAMAAVKRGYHCLVFEGPGQGKALRQQGLIFRPDWEKVITPVVDYAVTRPEVDPEKIAVLGYSFGGYLVPRAACFEHRPKVYIANSGVWDMHDAQLGDFPPELMSLVDTNPEAFDMEFTKIMEQSTVLTWGVNDSKWKIGGESAAETVERMKAYALTDELVANIKSTMLIVDAEGDVLMPLGQAKRLYDAIKGPKDWMFFTIDEGAEAHCQSGAHATLYQRTYDWLDDFFAKLD
jgi:esterase/lipase